MGVLAMEAIHSRNGNLPAEVTGFVGRRREIAEVKRLLSESRIVTLTGSGGVGKTRLAVRVAAEVQRAFPDGVWLVPLADLADPELVAETVAATLGMQDRSTGRLLGTLADYLSRRHLLLVLDNCEHLVDATAAFVQAVLPRAPKLRALATSRQSLGTSGERAWQVPPLPTPPRTEHPDRVHGELRLIRSDAVELFAQRARAASPGFTLTPGNSPAVLEICRRLDGIPLALELAAARLRSLSAEQILQRLDDRFGLLTGGDRTGAARQRSLRALIDWSYEQCTKAERSVWQRASVFAGGFDLEAAEQVCAGDGVAAEGMLDLVDGLVDKSILSMDVSAGRARYRMLDTIRRYGLDKLTASGQRTAVQYRHRDHFQTLARIARQHWFGPHQVTWFARLQREYPNLRAALEFSLTQPGEAHTALAISTDLLFLPSLLLSEARHWYDRGLALAPEASPARASALCANTWIAILQGDFAEARRMARECRTLAERLDDTFSLVNTSYVLGMLALSEGDPASAVPHLEKALAGHRTLGDPVWITGSLRCLAIAVGMCEDMDRAATLCESALAESEAHGEVWSRAWTLRALSWVMARQGEHQRAEATARECLRSMHELDDHFGIGHALEVLAWAAAPGSPQRAVLFLGAAQTVLRDIGASVLPYLREHDDFVAALRARLGEKEFTATYERGAALTTHEAVAEALATGPAEAAAAAPPHEGDEHVPLTRREREVAELVAEGLTNKEIAARMVISRRTAEGHVANIMTKLGFTSRAQIAALAARKPDRMHPG